MATLRRIVFLAARKDQRIEKSLHEILRCAAPVGALDVKSWNDVLAGDDIRTGRAVLLAAADAVVVLLSPELLTDLDVEPILTKAMERVQLRLWLLVARTINLAGTSLASYALLYPKPLRGERSHAVLSEVQLALRLALSDLDPVLCPPDLEQRLRAALQQMTSASPHWGDVGILAAVPPEQARVDEPLNGATLMGRQVSSHSSLRALLASVSLSRWVLCGGVGSGKTAVLQHLVGHLARHAQLVQSLEDWRTVAQPLLALYIDLSDGRYHWEGDRKTNLIEILASEHQALDENVAILLQRAWLAGRLWLFLDGADEISATARTRLSYLITQLPDSRGRILVASRDENAGLAVLGRETALLVMRDLSHPAQRHFIASWRNEDAPGRSGIAQMVTASLRNDPQLAELGQVPQLLAFLLEVQAGPLGLHAPPTSRARLIDMALRKRLEEAGATQEEAELLFHCLGKRLLDLLPANGWHHPHRDCWISELADVVAGLRGGRSAEPADRGAADRLHGLGLKSALWREDNRRHVRFTHQLYPTFLCAFALSRQPDSERKKLRAEPSLSAMWSEVRLLCLGILASKRGMEAEAEAMLKEFLPDAVPNLPVGPGRLQRMLQAITECERLPASVAGPLLIILTDCVKGELPDSAKEARRGVVLLASRGVSAARAALIAELYSPRPAVQLVQAVQPLLATDAALQQGVRKLALHPIPTLREAALSSLRELVPDDDSLHQLYLRALDDPEDVVVHAAVGALIPLWSSHPEICAALTPLLDRPGSCGAAISAATTLHEVPTEFHNWLQSRLATTSGVARFQLLRVLNRSLSGFDSQEEYLPYFRAVLKEENMSLRILALVWIAVLSKVDIRFRALVADALSDDWLWTQEQGTARLNPHWLAKNIEIILWSIEDWLSSAPGLEQNILHRLRHGDTVTRTAIVSAFGRHALLRPQLHLLLADPSTSVRCAVLRALPAPPSSELVARLGSILHDWSGAPVSARIAMLGPLAVHDGRAYLRLWRWAQSDNETERAAAIGTLATFLGRRPRVQRQLVRALRDPAATVCQAALDVLDVSILGNHAESIAAVNALLDHSKGSVRYQAAQLLTPIVKDRPELWPRFHRLLGEQDFSLRFVAIDALMRPAESDPALLIELAQAYIAPLGRPPAPDCDASIQRQAVTLLVMKSRLEDRQFIEHSLGEKNSELLAPLKSAWDRLDKWNTGDPILRQEVVQSASPSSQSISDQYHALKILASARENDAWLVEAILQKYQASPVEEISAAAFAIKHSRSQGLAKAESGALDSWEHIKNRSLIEKCSAVACLKSPYWLQHPMILQTVLQFLEHDPGPAVRVIALQKLIEVLPFDAALRRRLVPWLGIVVTKETEQGETNFPADLDPERVRWDLARSLGQFLNADPELCLEVVALLDSPAWQPRLGAAWALSATPQAPSPEIRARIRQLPLDNRTMDQLMEKLLSGRLLLQQSETRVEWLPSVQQVVAAALSYGVQPWYLHPHSAIQVRKEAVALLTEVPNATHQLIETTSQDPAPAVREAALRILEQLPPSTMPVSRDGVLTERLAEQY